MPILDFFVNTFVTFIYQPFFNLLVFFYWLIDVVTGGYANMGIAVILLAIALRTLLLPLSIRGMKTEAERIAVAREVQSIETEYAHDPISLQIKKKEVLRSQPKLVFAEVINLVVQIMVALMVWQMFRTGLEGKDIYLIYPFPFLQNVPLPFNLEFMGYNLGERSFLFLFISILLLFIMETLSVIAAPPGSLSRSRALKAQLVLPIASFFLFMLMPAGKVLFLIVTFSYSIVLTIYKIFVIRFELYKQKVATESTDEQVLVETK